MSNLQEDDIKRWTAKRKSALVLDIIQGKAMLELRARKKLDALLCRDES